MNIDELKRALLASGMCVTCVDKAMGMIADHGQRAYMDGYDRGWAAGIVKPRRVNKRTRR